MSIQNRDGPDDGLSRFAVLPPAPSGLPALTVAVCSRERPKCRACQPWPSTCDYTRDASSSRPRKARKGDAQSHKPLSIASTKQQAPTRQSASIDNPEALTSYPQQGADVARQTFPPADKSTLTSQATDSNHQRLPDQASGNGQGVSSFSFLREATLELNKASSLVGSPARENARSELRTLHTSLAMNAKGEMSIDRAAKAYHVPTRSAGYAYISKFLAASSMGHLFLQEPTDECLRQVIFDPDNVTQKAWIVFINYMLLGMVSTEPGRSDEARRLRSNVHIALNDSSIFITPSIVNTQTLATLAIHGEDFASPSQSWMLVGHACRQAEALALHLPASPDADEEQRRLCLFWLLFVIDKGCSLAFGRPSTLSTSTYGHTPDPAHQYLARHCPHMSEVFGSSGRSQTSHFGARFYLTAFELSKLIGLVLDVNMAKDAKTEKVRLKQQLEEWYRTSNDELSAAMEAEVDSTNAAQQREMSLGIRSYKFQYLHLLIILLKDDPSHSTLRIASAREALSLLPDMVSNWGSVYNGIVWQLLYLPFGPFFVIFGNILSDPAAWTVETDLQYLRTTVTYFESMCTQLSLLATLASRLAQTAGVFVQLAQHHVNASAPQAAARSATQGLDGLADIDLEAIESYLDWLPGGLPSAEEIVEPNAMIYGGVESVASNKRKRRFDDVFDWFSWDSYYAGIDI